MTLRPTLNCLDIREIRVLNYFVLFGLALAVFILTDRVVGRKYGLASLAAILIARLYTFLYQLFCIILNYPCQSADKNLVLIYPQ